MKLKNSVFLWVFLATAVPLSALSLYATAYSERLYLEDVHREINASLGNVASEIRRRLLLERELLSGLAEVPAVNAFVPVLKGLSQGELHPEFVRRAARLEQFLEDFQAIIPSMSALRVLDVRGNSLIRVLSGSRIAATAGTSDTFPYVEERVEDAALQRFLDELPPGEFGYGLLPQDQGAEGEFEVMPVFDTFFAIGNGERAVGYLVAKVRRGPIDRVLHVTPRLQDGELLIAEINPEHPMRDGLVLYDDRSGLSLDTVRLEVVRLQERYPALYDAVLYQSDGFLDRKDGHTRIYYQEYYPYPDQLISWVVATRIDLRKLGAPFQRIRVAILVAAALALLVSALLARLGAYRIARPVMELAGGLIGYADGERKRRVQERGPDEIQRAGSAFNYMADTLEKAEQERDQAQAAMVQNARLASIGQMAAGIGHEINNPLNNILSLTRLMERSAVDEGLRRDVSSVREEALRASRVIRAVLNFARQVPPDYTRFDVRPWLDEVLALVAREAEARNVSLNAEVRGHFSVEGDRDLLQQTLINLLLNAIHASPAGAGVQVVVEDTERGLQIAVDDQGTGIPEDDLEKIFDPFFTNKPVGDGSGLGLSISLGIVQRHGGQLTVANRPAGGVTATVLLPRVAETGAALTASA